jgi:16S rRNA (guanine(1405)-N(7))-methyltransferase
MKPAIETQAVLQALSKSKRYRHLAPTLLARIAGEEIPKAKNTADAEKRAKRRLHQIFGAYATPLPYEKLIAKLQAARHDPAAFKRACADIMQLHASTAERLPELDHFYSRIFHVTGKPAKVIDLACGLNPVSIPWMHLSPHCLYVAFDIDSEMIRFLDRYLAMAPVHGVARVRDLVEGPPHSPADVAFLLKTLPCLQHQTDRLLPLLDAVNARHLVVSFPTRSLGNRSKGMTATYRQFFLDLIKGRNWETRELEFSSELVFVVTKPPKQPA